METENSEDLGVWSFWLTRDNDVESRNICHAYIISLYNAFPINTGSDWSEYPDDAEEMETGFEEEVKTADGGNKCDPPPNKALALSPSIYFHGGPASNTVF